MKWLVACALLVACRGEEAPPPAPPPPATLPAGELATVTEDTIASGPLVSGTLQASRGAAIVAELGGTVRMVGPDLGERVRKGTLLARIEETSLGAATASAEAQVASSDAQLAVARREVARSRTLVQAGAIPRRDLELAESQLAAQEAVAESARAQLASAREALGNATVRAPIDGVVARRAVKVGDVVAAGTPLYELIDPSSLRVEAAVPTDDVAALALGTEVRFEVRGYPDRTFTGRITRIAPAADPATRQIPILVEIPNPSGQLLAGLYVQGRLAAEAVRGLAIPGSAVDASEGSPSVLRVRGGVVERVPVTLGLRDPLSDRVIVQKGLAAGDRIVTRATAAPAPGTQVAIRPAG